jgi:very-short-patch-repair endonuclease
MPVRNIVIGQKITSEKHQRAKELRQNMTPEEMLLWRALRTNKLAGWHFRRQQVIDGFIVDFYCHAASLIIEVDGGIHDMQKEQDAVRDAHFVSRGFRILRVTNEEVIHDIDGVLRRILENLNQT